VIRPFIAALAASCACLPAAALLIRADRDDAEYRELATRYAASLPLPASAGEGVLITPRWVLTAAACAQRLQESRLPLAHGGRKYPIESIHVDGDLALLRLREPVEGAEPVKIYRASDEAGKGVAIVGHGATGSTARPAPADGQRRAGINTIDGVTDRTLEVRIKSGDDASDLQGALSPGEIGAGAYVADADGVLWLAGIAQSVGGMRETFTRLSPRFDWIEGVLQAVAAQEARTIGGPGFD